MCVEVNAMSTLRVWDEIKNLFFELLREQTETPETLELGTSVLTWFEKGDMEEVEKNLQLYIHKITEDQAEGAE